MEDFKIGTKIKLHSFSDWAKVKSPNGGWTLYKDDKNLCTSLSWDNTFIEYEYDDIEIFDNCLDYFRVRLGKGWGVIDNHGKEIIECNYDVIEFLTSDYFIVHINNKSQNNLSYMGIYDKHGNRIFAPTLIDITTEKDDEDHYCYVEDYDGKKGLVNLNDENLWCRNLSCQYEDIVKEKYDDNTIFRIIIRNGDNSKSIGYLDNHSYTIIPPVFENISFLKVENYCQNFICKYKTKYGLTGVFSNSNLINVTAYETFVECERILHLKKNQLSQKEAYLYNLRLYKSAIIIPPIYQYIYYENSFYRCISNISQNNYWEENEYDIYNEEGKKIINMSRGKIYDALMNELLSEDFYYRSQNNSINGILFYLDKKKGLISKVGSVIIPPKYDDFEILNEQQNNLYFKVKYRNRYGIYGNNKQLYPPLCDEIFTDTFIHINAYIKGWIIKENNQIGVVYYDGSLIYPYYDSLKCNAANEYIVERNGKFGIVTLNNTRTDVIYDSMEFNYGKIYGRIGRKLFVFTNITLGELNTESSYLIEDLSNGYSDYYCNLFTKDCENTNILTRKYII